MSDENKLTKFEPAPMEPAESMSLEIAFRAVTAGTIKSEPEREAK